MIFFENNLLLQSDVVFDSESNGRHFGSPAPPGSKKKIILNFFYKMTSLLGVDVFTQFLEIFLELNYDHSTQNRKLHQAVVTV